MTVVPSTSEAQVLKREMQEDHNNKDSATLTPERQQTDGSTKQCTQTKNSEVDGSAKQPYASSISNSPEKHTDFFLEDGGGSLADAFKKQNNNLIKRLE